VEEQTTTRIERNNGIFREANDRIREAAARYEHELEEIPFLCECPTEDCVEIIRLTEEQYAAVRAEADHYMTVPGHETAEAPVGEVISRNDSYVLVRK
jgi:hypothetical protein